MPESFNLPHTHYTTVADLVRTSANEIFSIPIDDDTGILWRNIMIAVRAADIVIDTTDDPQNRQQIVDDALRSLIDIDTPFNSGFPDIDEAITNLGHRVRSFEPGLQEHFVNKLGQICRITEELRITDSPKELARLTRLEGQLTSRLLTMTAPDGAKENPAFPTYVRWVASLGRFGNVVDTTLDLPADYTSGISRVNPTFSNRFSLLMYTAPDLRYIAKHMNTRTLGGLAMSMKHATNNVKSDFVYRSITAVEPIEDSV